MRVSEEARAELADIWLYLVDREERAADRLVEEAANLHENLCDFPGIGVRRGNPGKEYRSIPIKNYVIYYRVLEDAIEIAHILHGSRNAADLSIREDD